MLLRMNPVLMLCALLSFSSQWVLAQSFDCSKANTLVESVICHSPDLTAIDSKMGEAYTALLGASSESERSALKEAQKLWIEKRDKECTAPGVASLENCLAELIERRSDELTGVLRKELGLSPMAFSWIQGYSYSPSDLRRHADDVQDRFGECPAISPHPGPKAVSLAQGYESLFGIASHGCDAALRVFLSCPRTDDAESCSERLILEEHTGASPRMLGELKEESRTGNSGGIFVPIAFTKNDEYVVLKAWMGSPGAGGGMVDYGYEILPLDLGTKGKMAVAPNGAVFYDHFGRVVYTEDSDKLPAFSQPGPRSNDGLLVVKDLATLQVSRVLEQPNTTFEIVKADEQNHTLAIRATTHVFSANCPRDAEDSLHCSKKTARKRQIPLP